MTDTTCPAALNVAGEHFDCGLTAPHDGLAHSSRDAQAIWTDDRNALGEAHTSRIHPLTAIETLLEPRNHVHFGGDHPFVSVGMLAAALADVREALGEVEMVQEWAVRHPDGWTTEPNTEESMARGFAELIEVAGVVVRRTVVTTRRVGEWEVAE